MSAGESIAYIGMPIMGGGMGAGAVPIAKVFDSALDIPSETILSRQVPAVALGNAFAIVTGGLLDRLGKAFHCRFHTYFSSICGQSGGTIADKMSADITGSGITLLSEM